MKILLTALGIAVWQAVLFSMHNHGELDTFWLIVVEILSCPLALGALAIAWASTVDWSK